MIAALLPVFLLIVLGFVLKRSLIPQDTQWQGLERLTYYVLFPALLLQTLVKADLSKVPVAGVGGALLLSALLMSALCLALRPSLSKLAVDGPAFTSIFQGATRWQTYVALAVSGSLYGDVGLALASVAMVAIIPLVNVLSVAVLARYAAPEKQSIGTIVMTLVRNPLIWACVVGLVVNLVHCRCRGSGTRSRTRWPLVAGDRPAGDRRRPASRRPVSSQSCRLRCRIPQAGSDAGGGDRAGAVVRAFRRQPRDRRRLLGGAGLIKFLCDGPPDGWRRAAIGANHHAADDSGRHDDADRDRDGDVARAAGRQFDPDK